MIKINKSINDTRDYEYFELDNKLKVIIITDRYSTLCGGLLNVGVGSAHDTEPGMAHFLEHMLFMGSEKYHNENLFMEFISSNGGITNASTGDTNTNYYFTINPDKFIELLDIFSWFFINPLLKKDCIEREINAVDSEAKKNLLDDNWIFYEMIKKNMVDTHAINHFTCGDKNFLKNDKLYEKVKYFFDNYYSSNIMELILFINDKINKEDIIKQIKNTFGKIENKNLKINKKFGKILKKNKKDYIYKLLKYIPNKDIDCLSICIEIQNIYRNYLYNPIELLNLILLNKSEFSLFDIYEKKGYIINFEFENICYYDDYILYAYRIYLTNYGNSNKHLIDIIKIFYDYIKSILNSNKLEELYNTIIKKDIRDFNIVHNEDIIDTLITFNHLLNIKIKPENLLDYNLLRPKFNDIKKYIYKFLESIDSKSSCIIYSSYKYKLTNPITDVIFNREYELNDLKLKPNNNYYEIINKNKYINDKVIIINGENYFPNRSPEIIQVEPFILSYNFNSSFKTPYVNIYISIEIPDILKDPKLYLYCLLYLDTIYSDNANIINDINYVNYTISMSLNLNVLYIYIRGDNQNIFEIIDIFKNIYLNSTGKSFETTKQKIKKKYNGFKNDSPIKKVIKLINKTLLNKYYTPYELIEYIDDTTFDICKSYYDNILKNNKLSIFISGNIEKDKINDISNKINNIIKTNNTNEINDNLKIIKTPYIKIYKNKHKSEKNCIFTLFYEFTKLKIENKYNKNWIKDIGYTILLESIISNLYFNILRTQEQLGYIVGSKLVHIGDDNNKISGIRFIIQSPVKKSDYLFERTQKFIKYELNNFINKLDYDTFNNYKNGEILTLSQKFNNLQDMDLYLSTQIFNKLYMFDYYEQLINIIKNIELMDIINFFNNKLLNSNKYYCISIDPHDLSVLNDNE